jgi:hypothetical protein
VDEFETEDAAEVSATSPRWTGSPSIDLAHQLNEQCIEILCQIATVSHLELPQYILRNRDLWRLLEPEARKRVAAFPFVIFDFRFEDAEWWREVIETHRMSPADSTPFSDLVLETLLFARQVAREDVNVAKAMFAMTSQVASRIASLTLHRVRAIAMSDAQQFRVRWDNDPDFWRDLLIAGRAGDEQAMAAIRRHGKLLFCGEFVSSLDR